MASVIAWALLMAEEYWELEELKDAKNWPFLTRKDLNKTALFKGNTLRSIERLKSEKVITELFNKANVVTFLCLRCHWKIIPDLDFSIKMGVSVSKKKLKHAVDRNTVKRRIRESYRIQKHALYQEVLEKQKNIALLFMYLPTKVEDSKIILQSVEAILSKISQKIHATKTE